VAGCCEHGNEPLVSTKGGELLDQLSDCQLLQKELGSSLLTSLPRYN
jgi:hypothetical protein